jgi:hypothetical protein
MVRTLQLVAQSLILSAMTALAAEPTYVQICSPNSECLTGVVTVTSSDAAFKGNWLQRQIVVNTKYSGLVVVDQNRHRSLQCARSTAYVSKNHRESLENLVNQLSSLGPSKAELNVERRKALIDQFQRQTQEMESILQWGCTVQESGGPQVGMPIMGLVIQE